MFSLTSSVQAELVRPKSSGAAGEEEEKDEEDEEGNRKEKRQLKAERSRTSPTKTQPVRTSMLFLKEQHHGHIAGDVFVSNVSHQVRQTKLNDFL